jgi:hypothetical protein
MSAHPVAEVIPDPLSFYENRVSQRRSFVSLPASKPPIADDDRRSVHRTRCMERCMSALRCVENVPVLGHLLAAGYLAAGSKDKAERAVVKATAGIACCICNFPPKSLMK